MDAVEFLMDTGPLVGFLDRSDQWHSFGLTTFGAIRAPAYTCEAVLSEAAFLLRTSRPARDALVELVESGTLVVLPIFPSGAAYVRAFLARYHGRADLADAAIMFLSECFPKARISTTDREDFEVFRWLRRRGAPRLDAPAP